jgi:hypothetical protein
VYDNVFFNGYFMATPHNSGSCTYDISVAVVGNNFVNTTGSEYNAIGLRYFYAVDGCSVIVKDNVVNYGTSELIYGGVESGNWEAWYSGGNVTYISQADAYADDKGTQSQAFKDAMKTPGATILLGSGDYGAMPAVGAGTTVIGTEGTTFASSGNAMEKTLTDVTFKNITFWGSNAVRSCYAKGTITFENCVFDAKSVYGVHFDGGKTANDKLIFKGCTFYGWNSFASSLEELEIYDSYFYGNGNYAKLRTYQANAKIVNCVFDLSDGNPGDGYTELIDVADGVAHLIGCVNVNGTIEEACDAENLANGEIVIE